MFLTFRKRFGNFFQVFELQYLFKSELMKYGCYLMNLRPDLNGAHLIHKHDCPFIPGYYSRILLGSFSTPEDALKKGMEFSPSVKRCRFCSGYNQGEKDEAEAGFSYSNKMITGCKDVEPDMVSGLFYGVN